MSKTRFLNSFLFGTSLANCWRSYGRKLDTRNETQHYTFQNFPCLALWPMQTFHGNFVQVSILLIHTLTDTWPTVEALQPSVVYYGTGLGGMPSHRGTAPHLHTRTSLKWQSSSKNVTQPPESGILRFTNLYRVLFAVPHPAGRPHWPICRWRFLKIRLFSSDGFIYCSGLSFPKFIKLYINALKAARITQYQNAICILLTNPHWRPVICTRIELSVLFFVVLWQNRRTLKICDEPHISLLHLCEFIQCPISLRIADYQVVSYKAFCISILS